MDSRRQRLSLRVQVRKPSLTAGNRSRVARPPGTTVFPISLGRDKLHSMPSAVAHAIIGTAGHIDHGKTALIRALTGQETDRLKEEQERGISIDLGFAFFTLPDGTRAGVVDVPGHERFIRNMLAGAHGIDLVLFTVAADDGVMPQSEDRKSTRLNSSH